MRILKPSELRARTGAILDKAKRAPVYVERNGTLLVITKAKLVSARKDPVLSPWELRAKTELPVASRLGGRLAFRAFHTFRTGTDQPLP